MNRVLIIHGLGSNDPKFSALTKEVRETFDPKLFRLNFFFVGHKNAEIISSVKSQSATMPVDMVFHPSCEKKEAVSLKNKVRGASALQKFSFYEHHMKSEHELSSVRDFIFRRPKKSQEQRQDRPSNKLRKAA